MAAARGSGAPRKVVVVGAGPGGLTAAMVLARAGLDVTVVERQPFVGGRTSTFEMDGFKFDTGPTFFLYPRVLEEIFTACGEDLRREVELRRLDPQYRLIFGAGGELNSTPDVTRMEREIARLAPRDALHLRRFLGDNRHKLSRFREVLETPFNGWTDLLRPSLLSMLPLLRPHRSVMSDLATYFSDPRIRLAFTFQAKYLGMSPFQCPSLFSILSFLEYEHGVWHPIGGCGAVSAAMARVAQSLGAKIRLNEPVEELLFEGRRAVGVRTQAGTYRADAVVLNADFARAMTHLVPDRLRRRWKDKKLARKKFSCSTFMLYLGLEGRDPGVAHHTIYFSKDYEKNLDEITRGHVLSQDPSFYVQNACVTDGSLAAKGRTALYMLLPVTHQHRNVNWANEVHRFRELALDRLPLVGVNDARKRIVCERVTTPCDWDEGHQIHLGATFNLAHNFRQMLHLRPRNRFEDLDGVYLVGGGTHPGSGLPVIYEGARISSRLVLQDFGFATEFLDAPMRHSRTLAAEVPAPSLQGAVSLDA